MQAIVLFAHGARDPEWARPFQRIRALVEQRLPSVPLRLAFLEAMQPDLAHAIDELAAQGSTHVSIVPLFMAQGGHLRQDVPRLLETIRQRHANITLTLGSPIGEVDAILQQIAQWIVAEHVQ
jgi:sirohydrochlorin cobaltochelatase